MSAENDPSAAKSLHFVFIFGGQVQRPGFAAVERTVQHDGGAANNELDVGHVEVTGAHVLLNVEWLAIVLQLDAGCLDRLQIDEDLAVALEQVGFVEKVARDHSAVAHDVSFR